MIILFGDDGQVYYEERYSLYGDYKNTLAPGYIQKKVGLVKALNILINELS